MAAIDDQRIIAGMEQQMAYRTETLGHGARPIGWKVGLGSSAAKNKLGLDAPLVGFLVDTLRLENGAAVNVAGWTNPALEAEIAIHIARNLPDGLASASDAAGAVAALGPAIEVADLNDDVSDVTRILAGNIYHRHVIVGPADTQRAGGGVDGLRAEIAKNGQALHSVDDLEANTGKLLDIVFHVANLLPRFGAHLRAGDVIIAGSLTLPIFVKPGDNMSYRLEPYETLGISLTG